MSLPTRRADGRSDTRQQPVETFEAPARQPRQERWEYRSVLMDREAELAQYGAEGWELVAVIPAPVDAAVFYFKRRL